jgi:hypothetical protein
MKAQGFGRRAVAVTPLNPVYHYGIDSAVEHILNGIARLQFLYDGKMTIYVTNDIPNDPHERSMGLTADQIAELRRWLDENKSRLPPKLEVWVLRVEDKPSHGMLYRLKNFTRIMTKI